MPFDFGKISVDPLSAEAAKEAYEAAYKEAFEEVYREHLAREARRGKQ